MAIVQLDPEVVAKIAAGEVIERPVSVVKELVENALDAGAKRVRVELVAGGCDLIRVADDGCGIAEEELVPAVQRHATSKIASLDDLGRIATLGFRGEALASIAAVSEMAITSAVENGAAHTIRLLGGEVKSITPASRSRGTTVVVERIFFNLPARRKYLRSAASESSQSAQLLSHLAMAYPDVSFELLVDGRRTLFTPGSGDPMEAAVAVLGREVSAALMPVDATVQARSPGEGVAARVTGYVARPPVSRPTRSGIWLTVNRRPVRSRALVSAVEGGFEGLLMVGRHPIAVLDLQVPPWEVDVNVHPTKSEVRLLRERLIYGGMRDAVRAVVASDERWAQEVAGLGRVEHGSDPVDEPRLQLGDAEVGSHALARTADVVGSGRRIPILRLIGQVAQSYIVAEGEAGLYLIDQHAAHERVLLERLRRAMGREEQVQLLLEPAVVDLTAGQLELARAALGALEELGFRLEPFGESSILVRGVPAQLPQGMAVKALREAIEELVEERGILDWRERVAVALSCRSAVKAGQVLSHEEMRALVESLEEADITQHCSHGRPTAVLLSHTQLEREFGRR